MLGAMGGMGMQMSDRRAQAAPARETDVCEHCLR